LKGKDSANIRNGTVRNFWEWRKQGRPQMGLRRSAIERKPKENESGLG